MTTKLLLTMGPIFLLLLMYGFYEIDYLKCEYRYKLLHVYSVVVVVIFLFKIWG